MATKAKQFRALGYGIFQITGDVKVVNLEDEDLTEDELATKYPDYDGYIAGYDTMNAASHVLFKGKAERIASIDNGPGMLAALPRLVKKVPNLMEYKVKHTDNVTAVYSNGTVHVVLAFDND